MDGVYTISIIHMKLKKWITFYCLGDNKMKSQSPDEDTREPNLKQSASKEETVPAATTLPDVVEIKSTIDSNETSGILNTVL